MYEEAGGIEPGRSECASGSVLRLAFFQILVAVGA